MRTSPKRLCCIIISSHRIFEWNEQLIFALIIIINKSRILKQNITHKYSFNYYDKCIIFDNFRRKKKELWVLNCVWVFCIQFHGLFICLIRSDLIINLFRYYSVHSEKLKSCRFHLSRSFGVVVADFSEILLLSDHKFNFVSFRSGFGHQRICVGWILILKVL